MNTLLNKCFCLDITNLIRIEIERLKFDEVLTEMNESVIHNYRDDVHTIEYRNDDRDVDYIPHQDDGDEEVNWNIRDDSVYIGVMSELYSISFEGFMFEEDTISISYRKSGEDVWRYFDFKTIGDAMDKYRELVKLESCVKIV